MLVLARKQGENIIIGDNVKVTVLTIKGNQVRIGIEAPDSVIVHREEIYDRIQSDAKNQQKNSDAVSGDSVKS